MPKPPNQHRATQILQLLQDLGEVSVDKLAQQFSTSEVTIRKDLSLLEQQGLLIRRFGGAVPAGAADANSNRPANHQQKAIAQAAAARIADNARIVIDSGLTTAALVPYLKDKQGLVVMSNSLGVIQPLSEMENGPTLLMPGGTWDRKTRSFQGQMSEQILRAYDFDQLFVGADGLDLQRGTTTFNELINLSRVMAEVSKQVIVMAESNKIGRKIPNLELPWSLINVLISDHDMAVEDQHRIQQLGIEVVLV